MNKLINYLKAARAELGKVVWPSRKETIRYTVEVIFISVVLALFMTSIDWILNKIIEFLG